MTTAFDAPMRKRNPSSLRTVNRQLPGVPMNT